MRSPSYIKNKPLIKRRRYNLNRIKRTWAYNIPEIVKLFKIHKNTVLNWRKEGLQAIDKSHPLLIYGQVLYDFLSKKQGNRKQKCALDELYCFKCRKPQKTIEGLCDITQRSDKIGRLSALCCQCETIMNKSFNLKEKSKYELTFKIVTAG